MASGVGRLRSLALGKYVPKAPTLPQKLKGGRLEKIGRYFKNILEDYKLVAVETVQDMKQQPVKSGIILTCLGGLGYLVKTNPSEASFRQQLVHNSNELLLLGDLIRNPGADNHMQRLLQGYNAGVVRRLNFGICSLIWEDNYSKEVDVYEAQCKPLKVGWLDLKDRCLDIGILGRWIYLERAMHDYDINPSEWEDAGKTDGR